MRDPIPETEGWGVGVGGEGGPLSTQLYEYPPVELPG